MREDRFKEQMKVEQLDSSWMPEEKEKNWLKNTKNFTN